MPKKHQQPKTSLTSPQAWSSTCFPRFYRVIRSQNLGAILDSTLVLTSIRQESWIYLQNVSRSLLLWTSSTAPSPPPRGKAITGRISESLATLQQMSLPLARHPHPNYTHAQPNLHLESRVIPKNISKLTSLPHLKPCNVTVSLRVKTKVLRMADGNLPDPCPNTL